MVAMTLEINLTYQEYYFNIICWKKMDWTGNCLTFWWKINGWKIQRVTKFSCFLGV